MSELRSLRSVLGNVAVLTALALAALLLLQLHQGPWWLATPTLEHWLLASALLLAYIILCAAIIWRSRPQAVSGLHQSTQIAVVWATQTGLARDLAERSAAALTQAGQYAYPLSLDKVDKALLDRAERMLFIVSTTGEGDPPDNAVPFLRKVMCTSMPLPRLRYGMLALGDRSYDNYCAFGRQLDHWLRAQHAHSLFECIEVDCADPDALRHWQHLLGQMCDQPLAVPDWGRPNYRRWQLLERNWLNPGSVGGEVHRLRLAPLDGELPHWNAGDIAEIGPCNAPDQVEQWLSAHSLNGDVLIKGKRLHSWLAESRLPVSSVSGENPAILVDQLKPLPHREYSIASIPVEGTLELLVRLHTDQHGKLGLGSGWLCKHARHGEEIALRIRGNPGFHAPAAETPLILIGNGTGIAGLRAHLRERINIGARRNWLLFGERNVAHDLHYRQDLQQWLQQGWIERLDSVFSRDQTSGNRYVQHALRHASTTLHEWLNCGAAIYVCGSLRGMAAEIDLALEEILGAQCKEQLLLEGRYRRDVY